MPPELQTSSLAPDLARRDGALLWNVRHALASVVSCDRAHRSDSAAPATPLAPRNVAQYEAAARALLTPAIYDYYAGGAEDELTLRWNEAAFRQFALRPRVLVDVSRIDPSVELLGDRLAFPVLLAPTAFQRLAHPDGELATARAAAAAGTVFVSSTLSTFTIEEIAAATQRLWLQLYVFRDRGITRSLVERAEASRLPSDLADGDGAGPGKPRARRVQPLRASAGDRDRELHRSASVALSRRRMRRA